MLYFLVLADDARKSYKSPVRERQAGDTRRGLSKRLGIFCKKKGYAGITIEAIARRAEVDTQRLRHLPVEDRAAPIPKPIHDAQDATFDLLRGAGVVAPELAKLEKHQEGVRYERQERMIVSLQEAGRYGPRPNERPQHLRDAYLTRHLPHVSV